MYKLSCERCVCFVFLVMVAFLSCSGFRIDRLAMTDISKRNSYTSSTSLSLHSDLLGSVSDKSLPQQHRIRHSRRPHSNHHRLHHPCPTAHIDTIIIPPHHSTTRQTLTEKLAQIPHPLAPTPSTRRHQRSPSHGSRHHKQQPHNRNAQHQQQKLRCQEQDVARKAYLADTVVLARAESMSSDRVKDYSVSFKIQERFKSQAYAVDDNLRLTFLNETKWMNCESELKGGAHGIVKAQIQQSRQYYLFLNSHGVHNYTVLGTPVVKRARKGKDIEKVLRDVTRSDFEPKLSNPILNATTTNPQPGSKVRMVCKVKGYPVPVITWKKNNTVLRSNNNTRITYSKKGRKSTLVIKKAQSGDSGQYYCEAMGVRGRRVTSTPVDIRIPNRMKCEERYQLYCQNGGTCFIADEWNEIFCECPDNFQGKQCETKVVNVNVDMNQTTEPYQAPED